MQLLTMLFTDVVESSATKRDVSLGRDNRERDRAYLEKVQTRHFELIRSCCHHHGGQEVNTMGDGFFLAFDDPVEAVRCAVAIQECLAAKPIETPKGPLRLRIGIHSGFPEFLMRVGMALTSMQLHASNLRLAHAIAQRMPGAPPDQHNRRDSVLLGT
jgi:class 3 adenylate cyclase